MKKFYFLLLLVPAVSFGQKLRKKIITTASLDSIIYSIDVKTVAPAAFTLPFGAIEIMDARYDTTKLGYIIKKEYAALRYQDFKKIKLKGGINDALQDFYNEYYKLRFTASPNKLLIVIKTLWINNLPITNYQENMRYNVVKESYQNIYLKFEYYLKKDSAYFPLKRTDTVFQLTESILTAQQEEFKKYDLSFFKYALKSQIEKYDFANLIDKADKTRKLTFNNIDSFNKKRFLVPALTASRFNEGVFFNFKDFSNNTPSAKDYTFKTVRGHEFLYTSADSLKNHLYWAIADSSGLHFTSSLEKNIIRLENTFEFLSWDDIYLPKTTAGNLFSILPQKSFNRQPVYGENRVNAGNGARTNYVLVPRQINMETGEFY